MKCYVILADGFEEAEAVVPADVLKRAGVEVVFLSITGKVAVKSSHGVTVVADSLLSDTDTKDGNMLFLPGGMPGSETLSSSVELADVINEYAASDKWLAAICAAPMVYGRMGLLNGRKATCYPGFESQLKGAEAVKKSVVRDGQFITACGAGAGFELGREMLSVLISEEKADAVLKQMMYQVY